jgi:hypothetical protein
MKSLRKFAFATLFTLSALSFSVSPASAEAARGRFTLTHEAHCQNAVLPAGEYEFSLGQEGPWGLLTVSRIDGDRAGYMLLVQDVEPNESADPSRLVLVSRPTGSFVDRLELPEFGVTLHFRVPAETAMVAQVNAVTATASAK